MNIKNISKSTSRTFQVILIMMILNIYENNKQNRSKGIANGFHKAKKLYSKLFDSDYNKYIRPVLNESHSIDIFIGLQLSQIIDVDEKNQYMTTNVWMVYEWVDQSLHWDPSQYEGVTILYVPAVSIWMPDVILYNTADGSYFPTNGTNAILRHDGFIRWNPPASFKVGCSLDVTYFPFDQQNCGLQFASWTYNKHEIKIRHISFQKEDYSGLDRGEERPWEVEEEGSYVSNGIDLSEFYQNVEWDLMSVEANKTIIFYAGSEDEYEMWTFNLQLRRKFLFYTVNLIIPLISHAFITILVFYIPAASTEKMALSINILLSLIVFFLMLNEIVPVTSLVVPLLGKYLIFTLLLVTTSIGFTVTAYQLHFRSASTHTMKDWTRKIFLYWMPKLLMMKRPKVENSQDVHLKFIKLNLCSCLMPQNSNLPSSSSFLFSGGILSGGSSGHNRRQPPMVNLPSEYSFDREVINKLNLSPEVKKAIQGALYISNHMKKEDINQRTKEDWKYVALVVDRIFLIIYAAVFFIGSVAIICQAPMLYDQREPLDPGKH